MTLGKAEKSTFLNYKSAGYCSTFLERESHDILTYKEQSALQLVSKPVFESSLLNWNLSCPISDFEDDREYWISNAGIEPSLVSNPNHMTWRKC